MRIGLGFGIAAAAVSIGIAGAAEFKPPPMKDGLWETHSSQTRQGKTVFATTGKICQSQELTKSNESAGEEMRKRNECTSTVSQTSASAYVEESRCAKGANAGSVTRVVYTFEGDTASHTEMHMQQGNAESVLVMDMKYVGACPAGMKPGDMIMPDGKKISAGK